MAQQSGLEIEFIECRNTRKPSGIISGCSVPEISGRDGDVHVAECSVCALLIGMRIIELRNGLETLSGFRSGKNRGISHLRPRYANIKELSHCRF